MLKFIMQTLNLRIAYDTNTLIYRFKQIPIIKNWIPQSLYGNDGLKSVFQVISILFHIVGLFLRKILYALLMIFLFQSSLKSKDGNILLTVYFFLTIMGAFCNNEMISASKEKYYTVTLMRVNAKKYALFSFFFDLIEQMVGFLPVYLIAIFGFHLPFYLLPIFILFHISAKLIGAMVALKYYEWKKKMILNNWYIMLPFYLLLFGCAYGLPFIPILVTPILFSVIAIILFLIALLCAIPYLKKTEIYYRLYRSEFTFNVVLFGTKSNQKEMQKKQYEKMIDEGRSINTSKKGYEYFNELFVTRHHSILTKSAYRMAIIYLVLVVVAGISVVVIPVMGERLNRILMTFLPYFVFIMYFSNRGSVITQAMFMNCDHSMLAYRFYRKADVILNLFKTRLKTILKINFPPTIVIALGLPILLYLSGGTSQPLNYFLLFISIIAMYVFFSVHYLVMYYLLQPYNINMEQKGMLYSIVSSVTYLVAYFCIQMKVPTPIFAIFVIAFAIIYALVALYLVYHYAPKTFHLK
ncbi:MAG: hypothetical protein KH135_04245 [Firmicutes bacterium]|nr:hypothetical protein [Bacillota bacterium]